jgi:hypothetical protein
VRHQDRQARSITRGDIERQIATPSPWIRQLVDEGITAGDVPADNGASSGLRRRILALLITARATCHHVPVT